MEEMIVNANPAVLVVAVVVLVVVGFVMYHVHKQSKTVEKLLGAERFDQLKVPADKAAEFIEKIKQQIKDL